MPAEDLLRRLIDLVLPSADVRDVGGPVPAVVDPVAATDRAAAEIVRRYALRCGTVGAMASVPGLTHTMSALPAGMVSSLLLQVRMILEIARLYGHTPERDAFEADVVLIMAGDATKEWVRRAGVTWSQQSAARSVVRAARAAALHSLEPGLGGRVARATAGAPLGRLVLLAGAPVGFGVDYAYARAVGRRAIAHYRAGQ